MPAPCFKASFCTQLFFEGHVFQNLTVPNAIQYHLKCKDDCLCVSMYYFPRSKENNCELNVANKDRSQRR